MQTRAFCHTIDLSCMPCNHGCMPLIIVDFKSARAAVGNDGCSALIAMEAVELMRTEKVHAVIGTGCSSSSESTGYVTSSCRTPQVCMQARSVYLHPCMCACMRCRLVMVRHRQLYSPSLLHACPCRWVLMHSCFFCLCSSQTSPATRILHGRGRQ